jgi:hypothetical protein
MHYEDRALSVPCRTEQPLDHLTLASPADHPASMPPASRTTDSRDSIGGRDGDDPGMIEGHDG